MPELVVLGLDAALARYEADEEVQDLLTASVGDNLGVDFLPGSFGYDAGCAPDPELAARILWLDAFTGNVDRSWRNPNLLVWHGDLWAIDHGASLWFHHGWSRGVTAPERFGALPYDSSDHVLRAYLGGVAAVDEELAGRLAPGLLAEVVAEVPEAWLEPVPGAETPEAVRAAYVDVLLARLGGGRPWLPVEAAA